MINHRVAACGRTLEVRGRSQRAIDAELRSQTNAGQSHCTNELLPTFLSAPLVERPSPPKGYLSVHKYLFGQSESARQPSTMVIVRIFLETSGSVFLRIALQPLVYR